MINNAKYIEMWKMLETHTFDYDSQLTVDLKCLFCNRLLIDACHGICCCSYCRKCITHYLNNHKVCPGNKPDCKNYDLSIDDIIDDDSSNTRVSELIVKCPTVDCVYRNKLINLHDHFRVCDQKLVLCPFSEMGCNKKSAKNEDVTAHLKTDIYDHSRLMIEWITNMKNEMTSLVVAKQQEAAQNELKNMEEYINEKIADSLNGEEVQRTEEMYRNLRNELNNIAKDTDELEKTIIDIRRNNEKELGLLFEERKQLSEEISQMINDDARQRNDLSNLI